MFSNQIEFANPGLLYLLLIIPLTGVWYWFRHKNQYSDMQVSDLSSYIMAKRSIREISIIILPVMRLLAIAGLIIALARPQSFSNKQNISVEGIDVMMAVDISGSMLAEDLKPNRLDAAKEVAQDFIDGRHNDRMGLVVFSGETFTQCPLTTDHAVLKNLFKDIKSGMIEDGTAIGDGLATSVNRLKDSKAVSKVIILLTDGVNNSGSLDPLSAAEIAKIYGIRVYTIGVGSRGTAPYPFQTPFGIQYQNVEVEIDEDMLKEVASMTEGQYFRATNNRKLEEIYKEIDQLEKSKIDVTEFKKKKEEFLLPAVLALVFLLFEFLLSYTLARTNP